MRQLLLRPLWCMNMDHGVSLSKIKAGSSLTLPNHAPLPWWQSLLSYTCYSWGGKVKINWNSPPFGEVMKCWVFAKREFDNCKLRLGPTPVFSLHSYNVWFDSLDMVMEPSEDEYDTSLSDWTCRRRRRPDKSRANLCLKKRGTCMYIKERNRLFLLSNTRS